MSIDRAAALAHLKAGRPVLHEGRLIESPLATQGVAGRKQLAAALPPEEEGGEYEAARHDDGTWTHAGLRALVGSGQGVLHQRDVLTTEGELPEPHELAGADAQKHGLVLDSLDTQIAQLQAQRTAAARKHEDAKRDAAKREHDPGAGDWGRGSEKPAAPGAHPLPEGVPAHPGQPKVEEGDPLHRGKKK